MKRLLPPMVASLLLSGCGSADDQPRAADASAGAAAPVAASTASSSISDADRAAVLSTVKLTADAKGQVLNDCGDKVTPQLKSVELGASVGRAVLLAMGGGPSSATCYGDGPGLTLFRQEGSAWRAIYSSRGGFLVVMPEMHNGAPELAFAGPGFSHPVWQWNGTQYEPAKREVPDDKIGNALTLP